MQRNRYTVRDAAHLVGVNPWTLRRLENLGHVPMPLRDAISGWRYYTEDDIAQLRAALARFAEKRTATPAPLTASNH